VQSCGCAVAVYKLAAPVLSQYQRASALGAPRRTPPPPPPPAAIGGVGDKIHQKAQADVPLHRLHYALPGWDAAAERRDAQDEIHSAAQARAWADSDFDADHGFGLDGVGRSAH
jgi:hypothetical protein